jgi:Protein of unknown function (DUF1761)
VIYLNGWAILAAAAATITIGFLWYGPLFGGAWMKEMAMPADFKPEAAVLKRSMWLMLAGALLTAVVMAYAIALFRTSTVVAAAHLPSVMLGVVVACVAWLGFCVPMLLGTVAWESRSWRLFRINAGYHGVTLLVSGVILAAW